MFGLAKSNSGWFFSVLASSSVSPEISDGSISTAKPRIKKRYKAKDAQLLGLLSGSPLSASGSRPFRRSSEASLGLKHRWRREGRGEGRGGEGGKSWAWVALSNGLPSLVVGERKLHVNMEIHSWTKTRNFQYELFCSELS